MYKVEIKIGDWDFLEDEVVTIETSDFEKAQIIQEFIEFQQAYGWAVDYDVTDEFLANQDDEDEEYVYDEETDAWYWYDEDLDTWYVYDEESDDWFEYLEYEDEDEDESEDEAEEPSTVTHYVITRVEE
jgi:hypothetical protein